MLCAFSFRGTLSQVLPPDALTPRAECTVDNPVPSARRSSTLGSAGTPVSVSPPAAGACVMCKKPLLTGLSAAGSVFDASMFCTQQCETFYNAMKHKGFDVKTVGESSFFFFCCCCLCPVPCFLCVC